MTQHAETRRKLHTHTHTDSLLQRLKQIVPICFTVFLFSIPTFATDPDISINDTGTGMCVYDVLDTYSGTAGFKANWEANNIKLRWYNGNTQLDVQSNANDCDYNGGLNVPSNTLTRTGYTFSGWVARPQIDFNTLNKTDNGTERWAIGWNGRLWCTHTFDNTDATVDYSCAGVYKELQLYEYKVKFSHGDVYGMSLCSETSGTYPQVGTPLISVGRFCWCKATGYKATNANVINRPLEALPWVFRGSTTDTQECKYVCSARCANYVRGNVNMRTPLYTPIQSGN